MKRKISGFGFGMAIAIVLMTLVVSGCGGKENPLSGTWEETDGGYDSEILFVDNAIIWFNYKGQVELIGTFTLDGNTGTVTNLRSGDVGTLTLNNNTLTLSAFGETGTYTRTPISKYQKTSNTKKIEGPWKASGPAFDLCMVFIGSTVFFSVEGENVSENDKWSLDFEKNSGTLMNGGYEMGTLSLKGKNLVLTMEDESFTFTKVAP